MKSLARRLAVPTLLLVAVLATAAYAVGLWDDIETQSPAPAPVVIPQQIDDDGGIGILADAANDDSMLDGGIDDAITIDMPDLDAPIFDAPPLFFDAPDVPGAPPGVGAP